jgi:probable HAF family extracellular repeat protein
MKTLLSLGLAAVALLASVSALAVRAGGNTQTQFAVTNLGPGSAVKASNPDADGKFLVVGSTPDPDGNPLATVWTVSTDGTVVGVFTYDTLGPAHAFDVNDDGMVVGNSGNGPWVDVPGVGVKFLSEAVTIGGVNNQGVVVGSAGGHGAVWYVAATGDITGPVSTDINSGTTFQPTDINDDGTICGSFLDSAADVEAAAIAEFDRQGQLDVQDLGLLHPADFEAGAAAINGNGVVVGTSLGKTSSAFLWTPAQPNKLRALGDLGGGQSSASDVNDSGQVVGSSATRAQIQAAFIWQNGKMTDLNSVLAVILNDHIASASGINNTGHIVGNLSSGNACLLTPQ